MAALDADAVRALLEAVRDPEIPALSIADLGVLRDVSVTADGAVTVTITPTYSGCPAMQAIADDIRSTLAGAGVEEVGIRTRLAPAWTTAWLSKAAHRRLLESGIAPPVPVNAEHGGAGAQASSVACPRCRSCETERISEFGSTACKALYRCRDCLEPFDYFKCL